MKISCFLIVTSERMKKLYHSIGRNKEIGIIGIANDLTMFRRQVLPITFRPDLVIMDFKDYKEFHAYLEPLRNNCRKLGILGNSFEEENSNELRIKYKKQFYFIQVPYFKEDLSNCISQVTSELFEEEEYGHFYFESDWCSARLTFGEEMSFFFDNLLFVRYTPNFTLFHLPTITYIAQFQLKNFTYFLRKKWMIKVSKTMILNLNKIHKIDLLKAQVTMVNGSIFEMDNDFWTRFVVYIEKNLRLSPANKSIIDRFNLDKDHLY